MADFYNFVISSRVWMMQWHTIYLQNLKTRTLKEGDSLLKEGEVDWGLNWNAGLETGGVLVGEDVTFDIEVQLARAA